MTFSFAENNLTDKDSPFIADIIEVFTFLKEKFENYWMKTYLYIIQMGFYIKIPSLSRNRRIEYLEPYIILILHNP